MKKSKSKTNGFKSESRCGRIIDPRYIICLRRAISYFHKFLLSH